MKNSIAAFLLFASFYACAETQYGLAVGTGSQNSRSIAVPILLDESNRIEPSFTYFNFERNNSERGSIDKNKSGKRDISFAVAYHRLFPELGKEILPYVGTGVRLFHGEDEEKSRHEAHNGGVYNSKTTYSTRGYGVNLILGAEYPVSSRLSVSAEVGMEYSNVREVEKFRRTDTSPGASASEPTKEDTRRKNMANYSMLLVRFMF